MFAFLSEIFAAPTSVCSSATVRHHLGWLGDDVGD